MDALRQVLPSETLTICRDRMCASSTSLNGRCELALECHQVVAPPVNRFTKQLEGVEPVFELDVGVPIFVPCEFGAEGVGLEEVVSLPLDEIPEDRRSDPVCLKALPARANGVRMVRRRFGIDLRQHVAHGPKQR